MIELVEANDLEGADAVWPVPALDSTNKFPTSANGEALKGRNFGNQIARKEGISHSRHSTASPSHEASPTIETDGACKGGMSSTRLTAYPIDRA